MNPHEVLIDALAQARLEAFHLTDRDQRSVAPSWATRGRIGSPSWEAAAPLVGSGPSLRVRFGRGLLALGAAIAGEDEPAPARRVA
ncbi:MAG: hypothetical protein QOE66_2298 [Chloroflexota bacterium]|jgi:hypothetical protein|nr:hypothetical protein [Chloroflexota bacterium]